jgi:hypothetical protein
MPATAVVTNNRGAAIVITLIMLAALAALGAMVASTASAETQMAGNRMGYTRALYLAEAGVHEAMVRLSDSSSPYYIGEDMAAPNVGWGNYIVLNQGGSAADSDRWKQGVDGLDNDLDGFVDESYDFYPEVLSVQADTTAMNLMSSYLTYPWVRVSYSLDGSNTIQRFGDSDGDPVTPSCKNTTDGSPIVKVTSLGQKGRSLRRVEVELVKTPLPYTDGVIYVETDNLKFNGNKFLISGQDFNPATGDTVPGSKRKKAIITTEDPAILLGNLKANQYDQVIGPTGTPDVHGTTYDLDLAGYISEYSSCADIVYLGDQNNPSTDGWGGKNEYHIIHVKDGNLDISGAADGGGILLVDGDLKATGGFTWYGLIIVGGHLDWSGGGNDVNLYGAILAGGTVDREDLSGNIKLVHSSEALGKLYDLKGFQILSWNEL